MTNAACRDTSVASRPNSLCRAEKCIHPFQDAAKHARFDLINLSISDMSCVRATHRLYSFKDARGRGRRCPS